MSQGTTRRRFTKDFKLEAVRLSNQPEVIICEVARNLGIRVKELYRWRHEYKEEQTEAFRGKGRRRTREEEVARLRRENEQLRMEREILKKATAFFASPLLGGTHS